MVTIITCTNRNYAMKNVFDNYERQQYEDKELIIILNNNRMNIDTWKEEAKKYQNISVFQLSQHITLGECYNFAIPKARFQHIAKFDDDDYYSPYYLSEAIKGLEESKAAVVGKSSVFIYYTDRNLLTIFNEGKEFVHVREEEEVYKKYLLGPTLVFRKDIYPMVSFEHVNNGEDTRFLKACLNKKIPMYSTSIYNFVYMRYLSLQHHTSTVQIDKLLARSRMITKTKDFHEMVTCSVGEIYKRRQI